MDAMRKLLDLKMVYKNPIQKTCETHGEYESKVYSITPNGNNTETPCKKCAEEKEVLYTFDSRELYAHVSSVEGRPWIGWFWSTVQSSYLPRAAAVFTVSKHIASYLEKKYRISRPVVIHNVPSRSTNTVDRTDQGKLRSLAGLDSDIDRQMFVHQLGARPFPMGYRNLNTGAEPAKGWNRELYKKFRRLICRLPHAKTVWADFEREVGRV